jgi:2-dehydro-3-deoxyphosphogalactonate aldolase
MTWDEVLQTLPLIAILRGVTPEEAGEVSSALFEAGFRCVEVTLNSPQPFESIAIIARTLGDAMLVGAGTVMDPAGVRAAADAGARLIVSPNMDPTVIAATKSRGLISVPAFFTPTEAFAALAAGADALKLFPAEVFDPSMLKAMRAVLPHSAHLLPVGGITAASLGAWRVAGAAGFGIGGPIYQAGIPPGEVAKRAAAFVDAWRESAQTVGR